MDSGVRVSSSSAASPSQTAGSPQQSSIRRNDQIVKDLEYLREQRICEKLEFLVKQLLKHQPEDPILYICSQLREKGSSRSNSVRSSSLEKSSGAALREGVETNASLMMSPPPPEAAAGASQGAAPPQLGHHTNSSNNILGANGQALPSKLGGSRVTTPAAARGALRGALERDESAKSDQSCFSIASVDMQEFLSEFRSARNDFLGPNCEFISRIDLAEIVDRVNLPLPDVRLIADLFDEMSPSSGSCAAAATAANPSGSQRVPFEAFLARMNFKIQGRYPIDTIRNVYYSLVPQQQTANAPAAGKAIGAEAHDSQGVRRSRILDEGLWYGLGIRLPTNDINKLLTQLQIPTEEEFEFQATDFVSLVIAVTGQSKDDDMY